MSIKINKNNKEYPLGVIPQSLYDDVEDLKNKVGLLNMRKVADSISTGTYRSKLQSLATAYNALSGIQRLKCILTLDDSDIFFPVNAHGDFFTVYVSSTNALNIVYSISGDGYLSDNGNISDLSITENGNVFSLWVSQ